MKEATRIARLIAANGPLAVRAARDAVYQGSAIPLGEALSLEQYHAEPLRLSEDAAEGVQAFIDRRPANFQGK
jgi:enoyl-CoA hydratase/carnithine racemase